MAKAFLDTKRDLELDDKLTFGKFAGCIVEDVCRSDPGYILWMIANTETTFDWYSMQMAIKEKFKTKPKAEVGYHGDDKSFGNSAGGISGFLDRVFDKHHGPVTMGFDDWDDDVPF